MSALSKGQLRGAIQAALAGSDAEPEKLPGRLDRASVLEACEASLKRLQTSYIDLPSSATRFIAVSLKVGGNLDSTDPTVLVPKQHRPCGDLR